MNAIAVPQSFHRKSYLRSYNAKRPHRARGVKPKPIPIGIDGEGFDHGSVYAYMAASTLHGEVGTCEELRGLTTENCLQFLLSIRQAHPAPHILFGFSLGYDYTKILADLPNESLWLLCRPEERAKRAAKEAGRRKLKRGDRPEPIYWKGPSGTWYALDMLGARLSIQVVSGHRVSCQNPDCEACKLGPKTILWDVFKFFQSSFVAACLSWEIISKEEFETLRAMKEARPNFRRPRSSTDPDWLEIKRYCGLECRKMADLAARLLQAHDDAGLKLTSYFGAGSTGGAMLDRMNARTFIRTRVEKNGKVAWRRIERDAALSHAVACAFFGGRFELSRRGPVRVPVWSYDISSAYPYAFTFLPCLVHGRWRRVSGRETHAAVERAETALVRYTLPYARELGTIRDEVCDGAAWGPFPFRMGKGLEPVVSEGDIVFPVTSGGGWVGRDEYLAGCAFAPNVVAVEAWIHETNCACTVLRNSMPENYKLRLSWGKEGKGIVVKLGQNSCYGKCAQTKGASPPYQEFVWALLTTGSCRAQLLRAMTPYREHVILTATDGILCTERMALESPRETGTADAIDVKSGKKKPLGGWEEKCLEGGVHLIRPGIAFPLGTEKEGEFKARGIGKRVLQSLRETVVTSWEERGPVALRAEKPIFYGMRSQVYQTPRGEFRRTERYGTFGKMEQVVSYAPTPKRPAVRSDGTMMSWGLSDERKSIPYGPILGEPRKVPPIVRELLLEKEIAEDQDDLREPEGREF